MALPGRGKTIDGELIPSRNPITKLIIADRDLLDKLVKPHGTFACNRTIAVDS